MKRKQQPLRWKDYLLDAKLLDGILSVREAGMLISLAFIVGVMIGSGYGTWSQIRALYRTVFR